jgi:hypothetical protein
MNEIFYNLDETSQFNSLNFDIEARTNASTLQTADAAHADYVANERFYENLDDIISDHEYDIYWNDKTLVFQFKNNKYVVDFGKDCDGLEGYNIFPYTINSNLKEKTMTNHQDYQDTYPIEDEEIIAEMLRFNSKDPEVEYLNKEESDSLQEMLDNMYETEYRLVRRYFSDIKNEKSDLGNL